MNRKFKLFWRAALIVLFLSTSSPLLALNVTDDTGRTVTLDKPAQRIVSLAPYITELLFAAGAGEFIVGTVSHSDYPAAAKALPRIGDHPLLDLEAIVALQPDLIVAWESGSPRAQVEKLRQLGIPVWYNEPRHLTDIGNSIERLGRLAGTQATASRAAQDFRMRLQGLQQRYAGRRNIRVFYQLWDQPLMTVNGEQIISDVIRLCGGQNVFADLSGLAPTITEEAVVAARPEVIVAGGKAATHGQWWARWQRWPTLPAVAHNQLYFIPGDLLHRHGPRILEGAERMCSILEGARLKNSLPTEPTEPTEGHRD